MYNFECRGQKGKLSENNRAVDFMFIRADNSKKKITIYAFDCAITGAANVVIDKLNNFH